MHPVTWIKQPEDHDFPSAADYLDLLANPETVATLIERLRNGTLVHKKAKDLLRAAQLPLLPVDNAHVVADLAKVKKGQPLSPILAVRGDLEAGCEASVSQANNKAEHPQLIRHTRTPTSTAPCQDLVSCPGAR